MDLDYISTRRLSRFYDKLKDWLSLNYSTKVELAEATQDMRGATEQFAGAHGLVPTPEAADRNKFLKGDATWAELPVATTSADGLMSATDKNKLDGIATGAQVNVIESVKVAGSALAIDSKSVNVPEAGGSAGAWVKGVVSGEDTTRWNSWVSEDRNIPKPILFKYTTDFSKFDTATLIDVSSDGGNVQYSVALENQKPSLSKVDNGLKIDSNGTGTHAGTLSYTIPVNVSTASEIVEEIKIIQQPSIASWGWFGNGIASSEMYNNRGRGIYMFTPGLDTEWTWKNDGSFGGVPSTFRVKEPGNIWLNQEITTRMEWTADGTTKYYWNNELVGTSSGVTLEAYPNLLDAYTNRTMLSWGYYPVAIITGYSIEIS